MNRIYFVHLRNPLNLNRGGMTVAFTPSADGFIEFAIAKCSDADNFNKKVGRTIASNRLQKRANKPEHCLTDTYPSTNIKEFVAHCFDTWHKELV
jgi:hypothetical protein